MRADVVVKAAGLALIAGVAVTVAVANDSPGGSSLCGSPSALSAMPGPVPPLELTRYRWVEVDGIDRVGELKDDDYAGAYFTVRLDRPRGLRPAGVTPPAEATAPAVLERTIGSRGPLLLGLSEGGAIRVAVDLDSNGGLRVLGQCGNEETERLKRAGRAAGTTAEAALRTAIAAPGQPGKPYASKRPDQRQLALLDLTIPPATFDGLQTLTVHLELPPALDTSPYQRMLCGRLPEAWVQCGLLRSDGTYAFWHRGEALSLWLGGGGSSKPFGRLIAFTPEQLSRGTVTLKLLDSLPLPLLQLTAMQDGRALQVVD